MVSHPTKAKEKQEHWSNVKSPLARHEISIHLSSPKGLVVFCQWGVRGQDPGVFEAPYYEVQQAVMSTMKSINDTPDCTETTTAIKINSFRKLKMISWNVK